MRQSVVLQLVVGFVLFSLRVFGFWPYFYDIKQRRYRTRLFLLCYPPAVCLVMLSVFGLSARQLFEDTSFLFATETARIFIGTFQYWSILSFCGNYALQYRWFDSIDSAVLEAAELLADIRLLEFTNATTRQQPDVLRPLGWFLLKASVLPIAFAFLDSWQMARTTPTVSERPVLMFALQMSVVLIGFLPNLHAALMLATRALFARLNEQIRQIAVAAAAVAEPAHSNRRSFQRMRQYCDLSERLERVAGLHDRLAALTRRVHAMFSVSLVVYVAYRSMDGLLRMFAAYVFSTQWRRLPALSERNEFPAGVLACDVALSLMDWLDVLMLAWICAQAETEVSLVFVGNFFLKNSTYLTYIFKCLL